MDHEKWETHPSYGMITVSRSQIGAGGMHVFGSNSRHGHLVNVEIGTGKMQHHLSHDWFFKDKTLMSFLMTEAQWGRFVSSFGDGTGTPVTFRYTESNSKIPSPPPPKPLLDPFNADVDERISIIKKAAETAKLKVEELLTSKKPATKTELGFLKGLLDSLITNVGSNLSFVEKSFKDKMDHHVNDAMINFEAQLAHSLKMKGLGEMMKQFQTSNEIASSADTLILPNPQE